MPSQEKKRDSAIISCPRPLTIQLLLMPTRESMETDITSLLLIDEQEQIVVSERTCMYSL